jgi:formylglycine-generating enzyme required for sulfatase activity
LRSETVAEAFYMLETQLTVGQHRALLGGDPAGGTKDDDAQLPAAMPYRDAVDKVLPALAKRAPEGWKVVLPDRARLEYAARAGVATMNHGGDKPEDAAEFAWTRENSDGKMHAVGQKKPNAWGLHDAIGNRWHWFWLAAGGYGDRSTKDHIVYGGTYRAESGGNGARLANIMISDQAEGARFALIREGSAVPEGHPETRRGR